jgi:hypothetical protein
LRHQWSFPPVRRIGSCHMGVLQSPRSPPTDLLGSRSWQSIVLRDVGFRLAHSHH